MVSALKTSTINCIFLSLSQLELSQPYSTLPFFFVKTLRMFPHIMSTLQCSVSDKDTELAKSSSTKKKLTTKAKWERQLESVTTISWLMLNRLYVLLPLFACCHQSLGLSSASTGMFYNGAGDLVLHFISQCNSQLTEILAEQHNQVQLGQAEYVSYACSPTTVN